MSPNLVLFHDDLYIAISTTLCDLSTRNPHQELEITPRSNLLKLQQHVLMRDTIKCICSLKRLYSYVYAKYTIEGLHPLDHGLSRGVRSVLRSRHQLWCGLRKHTHVLIREEWYWEFLIVIIAKTNTVPSSYVYFVLFLVISVDYLQKDLCHFSHKSYVVLPDLITQNNYY